MKFFILTGSKKLSTALREFIQYVFPHLNPEFFFGYFGRLDLLNPSEWSSAEILAAEAMNPDDSINPEGWRTAKKSNKKSLVFFTIPIKNFEPNKFFIATSILELKGKIERVVKFPPASQGDYEAVEEKYPFLKYEPKHYHP